MKIHFSHLQQFLPNNISIEEVSNLLFQLGHENSLSNNILDIEFTPNKGDCLSVYGLARDLRSLLDINLDLDIFTGHIDELDFNFVNESKNFCPSISFLKIEITKPTDSYKPYLEAYFKDLKNIKNNFFTDISNYLAYEIGQPTHCYEFEKVKKGINLIPINEESEFKTLIGKNIKLSKGEKVFKRNNEIINFAGVMGGESTKCNSSTVTALVESAFFNPDIIIGKTVKYDLTSEASYRFERGVDALLQNFALRRFIQIVRDHVEVKSISINSYNSCEHEYKYIENNHKKINDILGTNIESKTINNILQKLGFEINDEIKVPSWRHDIESVNDLAEEVARVIGYNSISKSNIKNIGSPDNKSFYSKENIIRRYLINKGFNEIINDPFVAEKNTKSITIDNPLDSNRSYLRTNLKESLLKNLDYNEKRQKESIKFFEISNVYSNKKNISSSQLISIIISGRQGLNYKNFNKKLDKKYLCDVISDLGLNDSNISEIERSSLNSKIKNRIFYVECSIADLKISNIKDIPQENINFNFKAAVQISEFPSSLRDISISIKNKNALKDIIDTIFNLKLNNLKDLFIFDYYHNNDMNIIKVGIRFIFQSSNKTLEDNEIELEMKKIFNIITSYEGVEVPGLNQS